MPPFKPIGIAIAVTVLPTDPLELFLGKLGGTDGIECLAGEGVIYFQ